LTAKDELMNLFLIQATQQTLIAGARAFNQCPRMGAKRADKNLVYVDTTTSINEIYARVSSR
jgi:hypothetical protein